MAKVSVKMPDEFLLRISRLGDQIDVIAPRVLEVGGKVVLEKVKSNLRTSIGKQTKYPSRATGELLSSLGLSEAMQDRNGNFNVKVGFAEPRSDGESNAKIANIIEYGKHGQPARPFLRPARTASQKPCTEAMIAKLKEEISKL
jgi:HK97 gp10 family phage protein